MAKPYSLDLRVRVIEEVDRGTDLKEVARRFSVTERTIWSWLALRKRTGGLEPKRGNVGRPQALEEHRERIVRSVRSDPGKTLAQRQAELHLPGCSSTLWCALKRWGITLKKSPARC